MRAATFLLLAGLLAATLATAPPAAAEAAPPETSVPCTIQPTVPYGVYGCEVAGTFYGCYTDSYPVGENEVGCGRTPCTTPGGPHADAGAAYAGFDGCFAYVGHRTFFDGPCEAYADLGDLNPVHAECSWGDVLGFQSIDCVVDRGGVGEASCTYVGPCLQYLGEDAVTPRYIQVHVTDCDVGVGYDLRPFLPTLPPTEPLELCTDTTSDDPLRPVFCILERNP